PGTRPDLSIGRRQRTLRPRRRGRRARSLHTHGSGLARVRAARASAGAHATSVGRGRSRRGPRPAPAVRAHALATVDLGALLTAAREAQSFVASVHCSQLAARARKTAIADRNPAATKEARLLHGRSLRVIDFDADGGRLQDTLNELERTLIDGVVAG